MSGITSTARDGRRTSHGLQIPVRLFSGAHAIRVIGGSEAVVDEHSHDWPVLSLFVMGGCVKLFDGGEMRINGPSAVLHAAGAGHANRLGEDGLEQIDVQFDPAWLGVDGARHVAAGVQCWTTGSVAAAATRLASRWTAPGVSESDLADETRQFLRLAMAAAQVTPPDWVASVGERLTIDLPPTATTLACQVGLHPAWLAQAYRRATGEGLRQTLQRRRVERAARLLRGSKLAASVIAIDAGFCDQSHMNRTFRALLGRTPAQVRAERDALGMGS